ncbi:hypothetical protein ACFL1X_01175 [Candidatus Hydrogenedentota bacterium]
MDLSETRSNDQYIGNSRPWKLARLRFVRGLLKRYVGFSEKATANLLDIGCGDMLVRQSLAETFPDMSFCGIDTALSSKDMAFYRKRAHSNVSVHYSLDSLPSSKELFDCVSWAV